MLVIAVGSRSQWGVILKTLIVEPSDTPLQGDSSVSLLIVTLALAPSFSLSSV